jgi:hypothetical protein
MDPAKVIFFVTDDGSVVRGDGHIIHFSLKRFRRDIVKGDCCFLCGAAPGTKPFNDEHVIPDWLLREFDLHDKSVTLPNGATYRYSKYRIPCCTSCNSTLGEKVEAPISAIIKGGYHHVIEHVLKEGPWQLFAWLNLIFFKTHLKDRSLRYSLDARKGEEKIGDQYDWATMHHIHCVVRAYYTGAKIDPRIMGSVFVLAAKQGPRFREFDYADLFSSKVSFIQLRGVAMFCVLDDAYGTYSLMKDALISKITGPMSTIQLHEIMARIAFASSLVAPHPRFFTDVLEGVPHISVELPEHVVPAKSDPARLGALMYHLCGELLETYAGNNKEFVTENLREGRWTFVFDANGRFVADSMDEIVE